jgi:hypothetical protein
VAKIAVVRKLRHPKPFGFQLPDLSQMGVDFSYPKWDALPFSSIFQSKQMIVLIFLILTHMAVGQNLAPL